MIKLPLRLALLFSGRPADPRPAPIVRDEDGRFLSPHREAVRAKCREQCAKLGIDVPEALR